MEKMSLGAKLKEQRKQKGLTQEEVAEAIYVSRQTVSNWETGKTLPDIESLIDIAQFYHLSLDSLLLKGSDVVEDIKKKERLASLGRWSILPYLSTACLFILEYRALKTDDMLGLILIGGLLFINAGAFIYFEKENKRIRNKPTRLTRGQITFIVCCGVIGLVLGFLSSYYQLLP